MICECAVAAVVRLASRHVAGNAVCATRCMIRGQSFFVALQAPRAEVSLRLGGDFVGVVAGAAPKCIAGLHGAATHVQLLDVADNLKPILPSFGPRHSQEHRPEVLQQPSGLERTESPAGMQDADGPSQVALLADAIPLARRGGGRIEYRGHAGFGQMRLGGTVAAIAGNGLRFESWVPVAVHRVGRVRGPARMAPQALRRRRAVEVRVRLLLHAGCHAPLTALRVVRDRGLKQRIANTDQVSERRVS